MDKKRALILLVLVAVIFAGIKIGKLVDKHQEEKFKANIQNQLKTMYDKDFVVKEESSTEGIRWTVGLSKWKKTSYICYRKDIPEIEFEVDLDKMGKTVEADNYQRKRIEYEAFQYYKPFFDAISDKYYIEVTIRFKEKNASSNQAELLHQVDMPLYLELHKKTFNELIKKYPNYMSVSFWGRINTNKIKENVEKEMMAFVTDSFDTKINYLGFSIGIIEYEKDINYRMDEHTTLPFSREDKEFRGELFMGTYLQNHEKYLEEFKEGLRWQ